MYNLDGRAYSKLYGASYSNINFEKYRRIVNAIWLLTKKYDYKTPEMWCSCIHGPFRKILEENSEILSKNGYISICGKLYKNDKVHAHPTNYIYCSKNKLALISYDYNIRIILYKTYAQSKATVAKNTMSSASNFEPACISVISGNQEVISLTSYQLSNCKSNTGKIFISSWYAKQPKGTVLRLRDKTKSRRIAPSSIPTEVHDICENFVSKHSKFQIEVVPNLLSHDGNWKDINEVLSEITIGILNTLNNS
ncbi:hypothetical protein C1645_822094 [Glomus cerebriforme]|uniref:Uncharacterized protein n=1 Tax=Glomus cerebriforme TaxID=658196 RepID=A0A397SZ95_9GLOM|nr:hypothetical protein C1645_822094 [Glomus cerebriforme]